MHLARLRPAAQAAEAEARAVAPRQDGEEAGSTAAGRC
ncbi:hypothetical protein K701_28905 [Streptomyces fradiae ATCC 10745 = DSM 40063]|uniref:Uncharacterized protein n=1 Tax=Streptomyces fradiae ATCC 10745 = DSM 40063 TaxID=1319510 RepID=A0ABQ6XKS3_STRFR|nr:hypothetical protein K701_28905 [Streptomyces fradiae ATCC 10745 = DSM 40063]